MKKIFLLLTILLILTGCSVKYNLTINEDLTITEEAKLTGTEDFFASYYKSTKKNVLNSQLNSYKSLLDENKYQYEIKDDNIPYVLVYKKYNNFKEYIDTTLLFNEYFDEVKYTENGDIKRLETVGFNENNPENPDRFDVKKLEIIIKCPFKVKEHNASKVDKKTNTYYYDLFRDNKIVLEYNIAKKFNPNDEILYKILMFVGIIIFSWLTVLVLNKKKK